MGPSHLSGTWNAILVLLETGEAIEGVAGTLSYIPGY